MRNPCRGRREFSSQFTQRSSLSRSPVGLAELSRNDAIAAFRNVSVAIPVAFHLFGRAETHVTSIPVTRCHTRVPRSPRHVIDRVYPTSVASISRIVSRVVLKTCITTIGGESIERSRDAWWASEDTRWTVWLRVKSSRSSRAVKSHELGTCLLRRVARTRTRARAGTSTYVWFRYRWTIAPRSHASGLFSFSTAKFDLCSLTIFFHVPSVCARCTRRHYVCSCF